MSTTPTSAAQDPTDDITRLRLVILRLARRLRQQNPSGITPSQMSALASIDRHGPLTIGELAALESVQPPTISRIVGSLEGEGYVERTADEADRRIALVGTTAKARRELGRIRAERNAWLSGRLDDLGPDARACVLDALPHLEGLLDETEEGAP